MISVDQAREIILHNTDTLPKGKVSLLDSCNRVLSEDVLASHPMPLFDNSAMDGYAVIASDTTFASEVNPVSLESVGSISAGHPSEEKVKAGHAIKIMTGAPIPTGADAVVMVENTVEEGNTVFLTKPVKSGENIRTQGSEILEGETVLFAGQKVGSAAIGVLASFNRLELEVYKKPKVAILVTGDELLEPGEPFAAGKIRNSNAYSLFGLVQKYGGEPHLLGIAKDCKQDILEKLKSFENADITIISGGISVGDFDFTKEIFEELGVVKQFWKVAIKPGKPLFFGTKGSELFFGLPGNPVSTMIGFELFIAPAMMKMQGMAPVEKSIIRAKLDGTLCKKNDGKVQYVRGVYSLRDGQFYVKPYERSQSSSALHSMSVSNCLIRLREEEVSLSNEDDVMIQIMQCNEFEV